MAVALCCPVMVCDRHSPWGSPLCSLMLVPWSLGLGLPSWIPLCAVKTAKANYLLMLGIFIYVLKTAKASYFYCPLSVFCVKYAQLCLIVCFCGLMKLLTAIQEQFGPKWIKMRFRGSFILSPAKDLEHKQLTLRHKYSEEHEFWSLASIVSVHHVNIG